MRKGLLLALVVLVASVGLRADTDNLVQQTGTVTASHLASWTVTGVIQDAGTSTSPQVSTLGIYGLGGTPFCLSDQATPGPYTGPYAQMCLGLDTSQAYIRVDSYNGASPLAFNFIINGIVIPISGGGGAPTLRQVTSGSTDTASAGNQTIAWTSGAALAKTETLFLCNGGTKSQIVTVKDEIGTAATYGIVIVGAGGNTIDAAASYVMSFNYQAVSLQCDGSGGWVIL